MEGNSKGNYISREALHNMLDEYYDARGWSKDGIPTQEKLISLGLPEAAESLS